MQNTNHPDLKKTVSRNIRRLMRERCIYISTLVEKTGISYNTALNIRSGRHLPSMENAVAIAEAIGVTVDELIAVGEIEK